MCQDRKPAEKEEESGKWSVKRDPDRSRSGSDGTFLAVVFLRFSAFFLFFFFSLFFFFFYWVTASNVTVTG